MLRGLTAVAGRRTLYAAGACSASALAIASQQPSSHCLFGGESYHLRYFDARGAAETARMLMVLGGSTFTDDRWPLDFSKSRNEMSPGMNSARANGLLAANLDRAPVLVVNGKHEIGQSKSIERYLSKKLGLLGGDDIEAAQIDAFTEHMRDVKDKYNKAKGTTDEAAKKKALAAFFESTLPELFLKIEARCTGGGAPVIGKALSYADVSLYILCREYFDNKDGVAAALKSCPRMLASVDAVSQHPRVATYLAQRPVTKV